LSFRPSCGADVAYERRAERHQAFLDLGCAIICQRFLRTF
jgi:hypothetical protein